MNIYEYLICIKFLEQVNEDINSGWQLSGGR